MKLKNFLFQISFVVIELLLLNNCLFAYDTYIPKKLLVPTNLPIEYKISQMLMIGIPDNEISDEVRKTIATYNIGGVVISDNIIKDENNNLISPKKLENLISEMQNLSAVKLFIATNLSQDVINELSADTNWNVDLNSYMNLEDKQNPESIYDISFQNSITLASYGINTIFGPSLDIKITNNIANSNDNDSNDNDNNNNSNDNDNNSNDNNSNDNKSEPSIALDINKIIENSKIFIKGQLDAGVIPVVKYFPGLGSAVTTNQKFGAIDVSDTYQKEELVPYQSILSDQDYKGGVMVGHIFNSKIDPDLPASLSKKFIKNIIRDNINFNGVVFSEDFKVKSMQDQFDLETFLVNTINAGTDVIVFSDSLTKYNCSFIRNAIVIIAKNVKAGKISAQRIDEAYLRIINLKQNLFYINNNNMSDIAN